MGISHLIHKTTLLIISLSAISCVGTDNRTSQEEEYALLENQRIAEGLVQQENIRDALREAMVPEPSKQLNIEPRQFEGWNFVLYPDPVTTNQACALLSEVYDVMSGILHTQVQIIVTQTSVYLRSDAVLSEDGIESGFRVDAQLPVAFDSMLNEVTARVDAGYSRLTDAMRSGAVLNAKYAYRSTDDASPETHAIDMELNEFDDAFGMFSQCQ